MAQLDFKSRVTALGYDFTPVQRTGSNGKAVYCKGKGFIPEPTDEQIDEYRKAYIKVQTEAQGLDQKYLRQLENAENDEQIQGIVREMNDLMDNPPPVKETREKLVPAMMALGFPNEDHLKDLPSRHLRVFAQWLFNEVNDPNAASVATNS